jgi:hypothetical protein
MSDKRQATTGAWVAPQPVTMQPETQATRTPTTRGDISTGRALGFLALAVLVASALGYLAFAYIDINAALAVFVTMVLLVFFPLFAFDMLASTGYLHRRAELGVESAKIDLAIIQASGVNESQDQAIRQLQADVTAIKKQIAGLRTIEIHDRGESKTITLRDDTDAVIDVWLTQTMFDTAGKLIGVHPSGVLRVPYPYKGTDEQSRKAHSRMTGAGLIAMRQKGNNYAWIGPSTLHETMDALAPLRDEDED